LFSAAFPVKKSSGEKFRAPASRSAMQATLKREDVAARQRKMEILNFPSRRFLAGIAVLTGMLRANVIAEIMSEEQP
jgi:hypothetical protein